MVVASGATSAPAENPIPGSPGLRGTLTLPTGTAAATGKITDLVQSAIAAYWFQESPTGSGVTGKVTAPGATSAVVYTGATRGTFERTTSTSLPCTGDATGGVNGPGIAAIIAASRLGFQLLAAPITGLAGRAIPAAGPVLMASKPSIPWPKLFMKEGGPGPVFWLVALIAELQARLPAPRTDSPIRLSAKRPLSDISPTPAVAWYAVREPMNTETTAPVSSSA